MAAQKGREMLLAIGDGASPETFTTVGGLVSTSFTWAEGSVDVTTISDTNRWTQLLAGAANRALTVSANCTFKDATSEGTVWTALQNSTHDNWRITIPSFKTITGAFQVTSMEFTGEQEGAVTYTLSLASAGDLTIADV